MKSKTGGKSSTCNMCISLYAKPFFKCKNTICYCFILFYNKNIYFCKQFSVLWQSIVRKNIFFFQVFIICFPCAIRFFVKLPQYKQATCLENLYFSMISTQICVKQTTNKLFHCRYTHR